MPFLMNHSTPATGGVTATVASDQLRLKINRRQQTDNTDIDDVRSLCKFVCRLLPDWSQSPSASEQIEITIDLECRERSRTGRRMVRIGLAVE
jgi:hypothetical protein